MHSYPHLSVLCLILLSLLLKACVNPQGEGRTLYVQLQMPEELQQFIPEGTEVKLINTNNGTTYKTLANTSGMAVFNVEYGIYRLSAQLTYQENMLRNHLLNGGVENILLTPSKGLEKDTISVILIDSPFSSVIINEIYYSGCYDENGKSYSRDGYITLYNNSNQTIWLDSLCIGTVAPAAASKVSPWLTYCPDTIPISFFGWQFPGTGREHPLPAGKEIVIAVNAVNHKGSEYNHINSVDLSKAEWAFYNNKLTGSDITTGVTPLDMFLRIGNITTFPLSISGPGIIIYRIQGISAGEYASNPAHLLSDPPQYTGLKNLIIPAKWILDCVDCVENATKQGFKRVPSFLDAESIFLPSGKYSGKALRRKNAGNKNGYITYQDTNNSANDFEECTPTQK